MMKWTRYECPRCNTAIAVRTDEATIKHDCPASKKGQQRDTVYVPRAGGVDAAGRLTS